MPNASITITEEDFSALFSAAHRAKDSLDTHEAEVLDKLARKANASLSNAKFFGVPGIGKVDKLTWKKVPSVFDKPVIN